MRTGNGPGWIKKVAANEPKSRRSGNYLRRSEIKRLFCGERVLWNLQIQKHQKLSRLMEEKEHYILETHNCPFSLKMQAWELHIDHWQNLYARPPSLQKVGPGDLFSSCRIQQDHWQEMRKRTFLWTEVSS